MGAKVHLTPAAPARAPECRVRVTGEIGPLSAEHDAPHGVIGAHRCGRDGMTAR
jgi:hypothetical protein